MIGQWKRGRGQSLDRGSQTSTSQSSTVGLDGAVKSKEDGLEGVKLMIILEHCEASTRDTRTSFEVKEVIQIPTLA